MRWDGGEAFGGCAQAFVDSMRGIAGNLRRSQLLYMEREGAHGYKIKMLANRFGFLLLNRRQEVFVF